MFGRNVQTQTMTANAEPAVHVVMGDPLLSRVAELYREGLAEAGVEGATGAVPPPLRPLGRTSFHVVVAPSGEPAGVVHATVGTLDQLSLGALMDPDKQPHGTVCECPSIAVSPGAPAGPPSCCTARCMSLPGATAPKAWLPRWTR